MLWQTAGRGPLNHLKVQERSTDAPLSLATFQPHGNPCHRYACLTCWVLAASQTDTDIDWEDFQAFTRFRLYVLSFEGATNVILSL